MDLRSYGNPMQRTDVLILGGGLVGLTLALALDRSGISSVVVDPADPATTLSPTFDGRASAIASASWNMLEAIGVAERLIEHGQPIHRIEVRDGLQRDPLAFEDERPLGTMVENRILRRELREAALASENIDLRMPARAEVERRAEGVFAKLSDGSEVRADLLVAAEGRRSPTRDAAAIRIASWKYDHAAIVTAFDHERDHGGVAHEIFYPAGPFALLPMTGGHRSAVVWSVHQKDSAGMMALSDHAFAVEAEKASGGLLGKLTLSAPRAAWPLGFHHAANITAERLALVGDAAHGIHPIAGQGLNLGWRDAAALAQVIVEGSRLGLDLGDAQLLARYQRWRGFDAMAVSVATDTFTRLFGVPGKLPRAARRFGIGVVEKVAPLKSFFMAEARGELGELPVLLRGAAI
jgi:2-octaprenyl-6-methoxyphenol hydroxylase